MSIYFGNDTVNDLYIGLTPVTKGYVGTHLFYNGENTIIDTAYEKYILNKQFSTLYNTAEKPIKSAILKGQTLKNLCPQKMAECTGNNWASTIVVLDSKLFNADGVYYFSSKCSNTNNAVANIEKIWFTMVRNNNARTIAKTNSSIKFTVPSDFNSGTDILQIRVHSSAGNGATNTITCDNMMIFDYYDGMENWDISYFEGMGSVKMPVLTTTGKNLVFLDKNNPDALGSWSGNGSSEIKYDDEKQAFYTSIHRGMCSNITFKPNTYYIISAEFLLRKNDTYSFIWKNPQQSTGTTYSNDTPFNETTWIRKSIKRLSDNDGKIDWIVYGGVWFRNLQIEEAESLTEYESYKSNILTVNEDVELRGIGDVKDELNLLTGELTQSIYNLQLTGDESWGQSGMTNDDYLVVYTNFTNNLSIAASKVICDKLNYDSSVSITNTKTEGINIIGDCSLRISLSKTKVATLNDFINWIRQEQPVINFVAKEKSIKTVDLSIVDQDGNDAKLSTFDDLTHVTLSSEGLIPEAELEVATKNEEVLNTMSLEMDDISTTQNALQETSDIQSENVDATMLATTEIYEGLL